MQLKILNLSKTNDAQLYEEVYNSIVEKIPYYKIEFIDTFSLGLKNTYSFLLSDGPNHLIIMPFHLREIEYHDTTKYYDVISTYGYSGPLFNDTVTDTGIKQFWSKVDEWYAANNVVSEFIRFNLNNNHIHYSGICNPTLLNIKGVLLEQKKQWANYDRKVRKNVNKAIKRGLTVDVYYKNITPIIFEHFYKIYIETMDRANASKEFYFSKQKIEEFIISLKDDCAIAIAYVESIPIASELVLISKSDIYSFLGGTRSDYFNLRPNDLLKDKLINWAYTNGFKHYILGGGYGSNDGIYNFKKTFFPNDVAIFYTGRKIVNKNIYNQLSNITEETPNTNDTFFPLYRK